ncbi:cytochrome P450 [Phyllosticta citriasiana]|uniref:Cytochrome P450 n=1 Tax=Phyllosticta citriasiana TaxID=595635 RepID=A0ABR1KPP3_9PEZI
MDNVTETISASNVSSSASSTDWKVHLVAILPVVIYLLHLRATRLRVVPKGVPWVGLRNEWFSKIRANVRETFVSKQNIEEGYKKYGKHGTPYITPNATFKAEVVLPPSYMSWLVAQPDSVLSIYKVLIADVEFDYTSPRSWKFHRPFHVEALNKMNLNLMTGVMIDEMTECLDKWFGDVPGEWQRVGVQDSMRTILTRITNRVFVGKEISHDEDYFHYSSGFVFQIMKCAFQIAYLIPAVLKPLLGPIVALPARYYDYHCQRYLVPLIQRHLDEASAAKDTHHEERNPDMLQLMARFAAKSSDPLDHDPQSLCARILALNFVGIHTSSSAAIAAIIDLLCAGPDVFAALRNEATSVLRDAGGVWNKAAVNKLVLMDSTLRESLRFSAFKARGVERQVVKKGGVKLPDGTLLPEGTKIGMPTTEIHMDPDFYDEPRVFKHDRFVGKAEVGMVNTTDTFLAFGHGKHACPGRFFSTHELKLLFAHVVLNYDFKFFTERPKTIYMSDFCLLPQEVFFETRRREKSAHLDV